MESKQFLPNEDTNAEDLHENNETVIPSVTNETDEDEDTEDEDAEEQDTLETDLDEDEEETEQE